MTGQQATASASIDRNIRIPTLEPRGGLPDVDAMPGAICVYLRSADGSLQFTYFSAQAESLLSHTPDTLIADSMTLVDCVHLDDRELLLHHLDHGPDEASVQFEDAVVDGQLDEVPRRSAALEQVNFSAHAALDGYFDGLAG